MSRVERNESEEQRSNRDSERRQPVDRTPGKAEGDENTIDEALRRQDEQQQED